MTRGGVLARLGVPAVLPVLLPVLLAAVLTGPAAADGEVVVSADGTAWSTALTAPLFDPAVRWVPGDARTATFWVANRAADAGDVAVVATAADGSGLLARRDVTLRARRVPGVWVDLPVDGAAHRLPGGALAAGGAERLEVRAAFTPASGNVSQLRGLPLAFEVVLSAARTTVDPPDESPGGPAGPDGSGHGQLPDTGGVDLRVLLAGLTLLAAGTILVSRKKDHHDHQA